MNQKIRIKLRSYDHNLVDKSTEKIVKTVRNSGAGVAGPIPLPTHTDSTILLAKTALWGLRRIYRWGFEYQKAGVRLSGLVNAQTRQTDLFGLLPKGYTSQELIEVMDKINNRMGGGTIRLTSEGIQQNWMMKRERISQEFTTDWDELLSVG